MYETLLNSRKSGSSFPSNVLGLKYSAKFQELREIRWAPINTHVLVFKYQAQKDEILAPESIQQFLEKYC